MAKRRVVFKEAKSLLNAEAAWPVWGVWGSRQVTLVWWVVAASGA